MKLRWSIRAKNDLVEIGRYIARDKPGAARKWVEYLRKGARQAGDHPNWGRMVPEWNREDIREVIQKGYRIVYIVKDTEIEVLTISEGHRLLRGGPPA